MNAEEMYLMLVKAVIDASESGRGEIMLSNQQALDIAEVLFALIRAKRLLAVERETLKREEKTNA